MEQKFSGYSDTLMEGTTLRGYICNIIHYVDSRCKYIWRDCQIDQVSVVSNSKFI